MSLNVGRTHEAGVSRMTFAVEADEDTARRIEANLYKLVNVLSVEDITDKPSLTRGLALIKVTVGQEKRSEVLQLVEVFRGQVIDLDLDTMIIELTGQQSKIDTLVTVLAPYRHRRNGSDRHRRHDPRREGQRRDWRCPTTPEPARRLRRLTVFLRSRARSSDNPPRATDRVLEHRCSLTSRTKPNPKHHDQPS